MKSRYLPSLFPSRHQGSDLGKWQTQTEPGGTRHNADTSTSQNQHESHPDLLETIQGMRVIQDPAGATIDIVFVHGFTGNRDTTWTHENGWFWPRQLAQDIKIARIMTFGYDCDVVKLWGNSGYLRNRGRDLAKDLLRQRKYCTDRRISFIAHSLGGLVCEQALVYCTKKGPKLKKIFQATQAIIFMATPQNIIYLKLKGHRLATYLRTTRGLSKAGEAALDQKSDGLTLVYKQFHRTRSEHGENIKMVSFYEKKEISGLFLIVPEMDTVLRGCFNCGLPADHIGMTKFHGKNDEMYQTTVQALGRVLNLAISETPLVLAESKKWLVPSYECQQLFRTSDYERHKDKNPDPVTGTCAWILDHPAYIAWRDDKQRCLLWLSGDPGCGKSVISKYIIDSLLRVAPRNKTICYFFFKEDNEDQRTVTNALCAVLHQLFVQKPHLQNYAAEVLQQNGEKMIHSVDLLWKLLEDVAAEAGEIICILDALEESTESDLDILFRKLIRFYKHAPVKPEVKFLMTSRPWQRIEDIFNDLCYQGVPVVRVACEENTEQIRRDIVLVVEHELGRLQDKRDISSDALQTLRQELTKVENRTYLWLKDVFALLNSSTQSVTEAGREKIFGTMAPALEDTYTAILNKSEDKFQARKILQIICTAVRPLSVKEMSIAITIKKGTKSLQDIDNYSEEFSKRLIRNACGLFVTVDNGEVCLLHQSAKEFLIARGNDPSRLDQEEDQQKAYNGTTNWIWKHSVSVAESNLVLAQICIWYLELGFRLMENSLRKDEFHELAKRFGLLDYSVHNWAIHFGAASNLNLHSPARLNLSLHEGEAEIFSSLQQLYSKDYRSDESFTSLHLAAYLGLDEIVAWQLLMPDIDLNKMDKRGRAPISYAAERGHGIVVQKLLEAIPSIDVNVQDENGKTALSYACEKSHEDIVKRLLTVPTIRFLNSASKNKLLSVNKFDNQGAALEFISERGKNELVDIFGSEWGTSKRKGHANMTSHNNSEQAADCMSSTNGLSKLVATSDRAIQRESETEHKDGVEFGNNEASLSAETEGLSSTNDPMGKEVVSGKTSNRVKAMSTHDDPNEDSFALSHRETGLTTASSSTAEKSNAETESTVYSSIERCENFSNEENIPRVAANRKYSSQRVSPNTGDTQVDLLSKFAEPRNGYAVGTVTPDSQDIPRWQRNRLHSVKKIKPVSSEGIEKPITHSSDNYWTFDEDVQKYWHTDSETQSVVWYDDSE